jgi:hypothetical protein
LIVAAAVLEERHVTWLVMLAVELSLYVPVAVNCSLPPFVIDPFGAIIAIEVSVGAVTVNPKLFDVTPLSEAAMLVDPAPTPVASPVPLIVATPVFDDLHVTWLVMLAVELSLYVPAAVNCSLPPFVIDPFGAIIAIDVNVGGAIPSCVREKLPPPVQPPGIPQLLERHVNTMAVLRAAPELGPAEKVYSGPPEGGEVIVNQLGGL